MLHLLASFGVALVVPSVPPVVVQQRAAAPPVSGDRPSAVFPTTLLAGPLDMFGGSKAQVFKVCRMQPCSAVLRRPSDV